MTLYVPILVAVDTDDQGEAHECAATVARHTVGESFRLVATDPDMPCLREAEGHLTSMPLDGYELAL